MVSKAKVKVHDKIAVHLFDKLCRSDCVQKLQTCRSRPKLSTVRRNLFGAKNEMMSGQLLDRQITDMAKKSSRVWNFDFANEAPRPGRYVWQRVPSRDVPFWYAAVGKTTLKDLDRRTEAKSANTCLLLECEPPNCRCAEQKNGEKVPSRRKPRLVQTTMKDFSRVKKRRCSDRLRLKQVQVYSNKLRNHCHHLPLPCRPLLT